MTNLFYANHKTCELNFNIHQISSILTSSPPFVPKLFLLRSNKQIFFTPGSYSYHQVFKIGTVFCIVRTFTTYFASQTSFPPELWVSPVNK